MKKYYWITFFALMVCLLSCKDDKDETPDPAGKLVGTWSASNGQVLVDGVDHTDEYKAFSITFSTTSSGSKVYTVANGGYAFHGIAGDTWYFADNSATKIVRAHDDVEMNYTINDNTLTLSFSVPDPIDDNGRSKGMFGDFVMTLKR